MNPQCVRIRARSEEQCVTQVLNAPLNDVPFSGFSVIRNKLAFVGDRLHLAHVLRHETDNKHSQSRNVHESKARESGVSGTCQGAWN